MKFRTITLGVVATAVIAALATYASISLAPKGSEPTPPIAGTPTDLNGVMSRGAYLAKAADCVACHTVQGGTPYAGGRGFKLPFGTVYATNLTPDKETGIGAMSDDAFVAAVRSGEGSTGHLYPAMPYTSYAQMSRDDVLAIKAYLLTLPPIKHPIDRDTLSFPFNQRWGMTFWNAIFFREHRYTPDATKSAEWNRGAYLAGALGHCGECHTPRNIGFAMQSRDYLSGAELEGWKAYNTTSDSAYGLGDWTTEQLASYLSTGHAPGRSSAAGPMAEVVENSLQYLTQKDISALTTYLKGVSPSTNGDGGKVNLSPQGATQSNGVIPAANSEIGNLRGKRLFEANCAGCHRWDGLGRQTPYASLVGSHAANDPSGNALIQVILHGTTLTVNGRTQFMPGFSGSLSDADVAALANYVVAHFGEQQGRVTAPQVKAQR